MLHIRFSRPRQIPDRHGNGSCRGRGHCRTVVTQCVKKEEHRKETRGLPQEMRHWLRREHPGTERNKDHSSTEGEYYREGRPQRGDKTFARKHKREERAGGAARNAKNHNDKHHERG